MHEQAAVRAFGSWDWNDGEPEIPDEPNTLRICLARPVARSGRPHACRGGVGVRIERPHCAEHADSGAGRHTASWRLRDGADDLHAA